MNSLRVATGEHNGRLTPFFAKYARELRTQPRLDVLAADELPCLPMSCLLPSRTPGIRLIELTVSTSHWSLFCWVTFN